MDIFCINSRKTELYWNIIGLALITGGVSSLLSAGGERSAGNSLFQIIMIVFTLPGLIILIREKKFSCAFHKENIIITILVLYCLLSSLWSIDFSVSLRRSTSLLFAYLYCIYIVTRFSHESLKFIIARVLCIIIVANVIAATFFGGVHLDDGHDGAWKGLAGHKNNLGRFASIGVIIFFGIYIYYKNKKHLIYTAIFLFVLLMTTSKTSFAACLLAVLSFYIVDYLYKGKFIFLYYSKKIRWFFVLLFLVFSFVTLALIFPLVFELLDRDFTFSGRTKIWNYALMLVEGQNYFGTGYKTFWIDSMTWDFFYYNPYWGGENITGNGHSGYLDIYLELGIVGGVIFIVLLLSYVYKIIKCIYLGSINILVFISLPIFVFSMIYNVFETNYLSNRLDLLWFLFVIFYMSMHEREYHGVK
jgi:O-antigen ligase